MRIALTSIYVNDQAEALKFYTETLGFRKHTDVPLGDEHRWITVVSQEAPEEPQLVLEPSEHPAVAPYRDALVEDGIPLAAFAVADVQQEYERLTAQGVTFTQQPTDVGPVVMAVFDDTCGNLIQIISEKEPEKQAGPAGRG